MIDFLCLSLGRALRISVKEYTMNMQSFAILRVDQRVNIAVKKPVDPPLIYYHNEKEEHQMACPTY